MAYQMEHDLSQEIMADTDIVPHLTKTDVAVVSDLTITEVLLAGKIGPSCRFVFAYRIYPQGCPCSLA